MYKLLEVTCCILLYRAVAREIYTRAITFDAHSLDGHVLYNPFDLHMLILLGELCKFDVVLHVRVDGIFPLFLLYYLFPCCFSELATFAPKTNRPFVSGACVARLGKSLWSSGEWKNPRVPVKDRGRVLVWRQLPEPAQKRFLSFLYLRSRATPDAEASLKPFQPRFPNQLQLRSEGVLKTEARRCPPFPRSVWPTSRRRVMNKKKAGSAAGRSSSKCGSSELEGGSRALLAGRHLLQI